MRLRLLPFFLLAAYANAQGDDTISSLTAVNKTGFDPQDTTTFQFLWRGVAGHQLNNVTLELIAGKAEDKGTDVVDIIVINFSTLDGNQIEYQFHPGTPRGPYHARMNGTIFNGDTSLSTTTTALSNTFVIPASRLQCAAGTSTPVHSLADPAYSPLRLTVTDGSLFAPSIRTVFEQAEISGPSTGISVDITYVDRLFNDLGFGFKYNATAEVLNTVTGFSAGVQSAELSRFFYRTSNITLDIGSWKVRMNMTTNSPRYPGPFTTYSDTFFVVANASEPRCEHDSSSSSSRSLQQNWWMCAFIWLLWPLMSGKL